MRQKLFFILLFGLFSLSASSQLSREILRGQIVSDSAIAERVTVFNISSNKGAVSDDLGFFTIFARASDTLVFSSVAFKQTSLVLTETDFLVTVMKVRLEVFVNELDEVVVRPFSLSGDLARDEKNLKVTMKKSDINPLQATDILLVEDKQSSLRNTAMPNDGSIQYGMDFVRIGKDILRWFKKDKEEKPIEFVSDKIFSEAAQEKFTYHFFTETLGLEQDEIGLFLSYCENDPKVKSLLSQNKEIELIDFLISKSVDYKKNIKNKD